MKPNFYLIDWCIRKTNHTKLFLYSFILIGVFLFLAQEKIYSQVQNNCILSGPEEFYYGETFFPDWDQHPYQNVMVRTNPNSSGLLVSIDFTADGLIYELQSNHYTNSGWLIGVDNSSMLEFARMDIAQKLVNTFPCALASYFSDTVTITILQRTPCWKARYCRIPIVSQMCCNTVRNDENLIDSNSTTPLFNYSNMPGFEYIHQGGENTDAQGNKYYYINAGKSQCGWKCCELKYKFRCIESLFPQLPLVPRSWKLISFERNEYENSTCIEDFEYSNPNCPHPSNFNPINPCTGDCNENLYEKN
ncbi:MAG: hypothetical protein JNL36_03370 [Candidatus Kapabacteria bacterium]|nr:hypothetical protein [Candidatus Kapabacteria bacterium]